MVINYALLRMQLTTSSKSFLENLSLSQLRNSPNYMEPKGFIIFLQQPAICPYPAPQ